MRTPLIIGALALGLIPACDDAALPLAVPALPTRPPPAALPLHTPSAPVVFLDLVAEASRAHVRRAGPALVPGGPGWARVSRLAGASLWRPAGPVEDVPASWLESIGGTLHFPVGVEGPDLRQLQIWLRPVARGQRVSIFVDEEPVSTLTLDPKGRSYTLPLPSAGLSPGEHSVRFWFRFRRQVGRKRDGLRSPAAIGPVRLLPAGPAESLPLAWVADLEVASVSGRALLAGPPAAWRYYLLPPMGARFEARAAVATGETTTFRVEILADEAEPETVAEIDVDRGAVAEIAVDLGPWAGRPIQLSLTTSGSSGALDTAGWIAPRVMVPGAPSTRAPVVRNVVVWAVDGLRADRVGLGRGGDRAATPNLDLLAGEGAAAVDVWSGGARPEAGHARVLTPGGEISLAAAMAKAGRRPGLLSASAAIEPAQQADFATRLDLRGAGEPPESRVLVRELDDWLDVRKKQPFFLYIAADEPRVPLEPPEGFDRLYRRARPVGLEADVKEARRRRDLEAAYDAEVSANDYWLGQLIATLSAHGVLDETAVVVLGTVGQDLHEAGGLGDGHALAPELLQVPVVLWHPRLRRTGEPRAIVRGGDLLDVPTTVLALVGAEAPAGWPGIDLTTALLGGMPLPPMPSHARHGNQVAARFGDWLLRGLSARDLKLWNLVSDPGARDEVSGRRPVALRTLRDSMLDRP